MSRLTEDMVIARTKCSDMHSIKKLNCWGSDLEDVSLVRRLIHVEVLSLSLNRITTLVDFQYCIKLEELYVRRNSIRDLSEICFLQDLPQLRRLLLSENPCVETAGPLYRATVLRCLPRLEVLDNQQVQPEDVEYALKNGLILEHPLARRERGSPEPVYYSDESPPVTRNRRNSAHYEIEEEAPNTYRQSSNSPTADFYYQNGEGRKSPEPPCTGGTSQSHNNNANPNAAVTRPSPPNNNASSSSADSVVAAVSNNTSPSVGSTITNQVEGVVQQRRISTPEYGYGRTESEMQRQTNGRRPSSDYILEGNREQQYYDEHPSQLRSAVVPHRPQSYLRSNSKPRTKTSNILSAVLCLVPELDLASLEVLELAVRRRIDECSSD